VESKRALSRILTLDQLSESKMSFAYQGAQQPVVLKLKNNEGFDVMVDNEKL